MVCVSIRIEVRLAWWLRWYLLGVFCMSRITDHQPDPDKITYWAGKAVRTKVIQDRA